MKLDKMYQKIKSKARKNKRRITKLNKRLSRKGASPMDIEACENKLNEANAELKKQETEVHEIVKDCKDLPDVVEFADIFRDVRDRLEAEYPQFTLQLE